MVKLAQNLATSSFPKNLARQSLSGNPTIHNFQVGEILQPIGPKPASGIGVASWDVPIGSMLSWEERFKIGILDYDITMNPQIGMSANILIKNLQHSLETDQHQFEGHFRQTRIRGIRSNGPASMCG